MEIDALVPCARTDGHMLKAEEYRRYATDLRAAAARMRPGYRRDQLRKIAQAWEELAADSERGIVRHFRGRLK